jgi:peptidoglycan/xylan/chitin deacetylase (PgdA/CDA1 family)
VRGIVVDSAFKLRRIIIVLVTAAFAAALLFLAGGKPSQAQSRALTITQLETSRKLVALTFDAGSDAGYASRILDTLKANKVKASFGMTGQWAEAHPALLRRIVREGHTVMDHTYSHRSFTGSSTGTAPLSYKQRSHELRKTESAVQRIAGVSTKPYFRPPTAPTTPRFSRTSTPEVTSTTSCGARTRSDGRAIPRSRYSSASSTGASLGPSTSST